jgi:hypothetical protein
LKGRRQGLISATWFIWSSGAPRLVPICRGIPIPGIPPAAERNRSESVNALRLPSPTLRYCKSTIAGKRRWWNWSVRDLEKHEGLLRQIVQARRPFTKITEPGNSTSALATNQRRCDIPRRTPVGNARKLRPGPAGASGDRDDFPKALVWSAERSAGATLTGNRTFVKPPQV